MSFVYKYRRAARSLFSHAWGYGYGMWTTVAYVTKATSGMTTVFAKCLRSIVPRLPARFMNVEMGVLRDTDVLDIVKLGERRFHLRDRHKPRSFTLGVFLPDVEDIATFLAVESSGCIFVQMYRLCCRLRFVYFRRFNFLVVDLEVAV